MKISKRERIEQLELAAYHVALKHGLEHVTRDAVADQANCSTGLVSTYLTPWELKVGALRVAVTREDMRLLGHLLIAPYRSHIPLPESLKTKIIAHLRS